MKKPLALLLSLLALPPAHAADWQIYTHSLGDEARVDGTSLHGRAHGGKRAFYLELMRALLAELQLPDRIVEVPLDRGLWLVQHKDHVALFNLTRTPEREHAVQWVGPISYEVDRLYESARRPTHIRTLAAAKSLPVCVLRDNVHDAILSRQGFVMLYRSDSYIDCFKMLDAGRVRLVASADLDLRAKLAAADVAPSHIRATPAIIDKRSGFIVLSKQTPAAEVVRWRKALDRLKQDGRYQALYQRYMD
ncbi:MAG: transporter substrate-binding domain-containing protein [Paludibacterium sp.]|uniref:substrate-binding periplasmic protein n=1 Tax=Paludibacterium sp. TaxID=1917523 RepID=UPI0025E59EE3|nr:transporter substrate-binding domain-containing protein [Paludibacterium sp.]MBV8047318.1 transporter substrate-binding domain-containing protein [Paludibacterium sp.]MBV8646188.1 transporter substrate-binding domain-containing protein [Paludibacterium sp.]